MSSGAGTTTTITTMTQQQQIQQNGLQQQQNNGTAPIVGKKANSSGGPTPASTPIQNIINGQERCSPPQLTNNAPKYGTLVPNRIFVGGISASTTEGELMQLFSTYGTVKAAKIIQDRAGVSKGYGFITFENEDDARRPLHDHDNIMLRERRLNIAPAIKKQPFGRPSGGGPPYDNNQCSSDGGRSSVPSAIQQHPALQGPMQPFYFGGGPHQFYPGTAAYYAAPSVSMVNASQQQQQQQQQAQVNQSGQEQAAAAAAAAAQQAVYQAPSVYSTQSGPPQSTPFPSMMFPQPIYMPQQYQFMPYDYQIYGAGGPSTNNGGGLPPPYSNAAAAVAAGNGSAINNNNNNNNNEGASPSSRGGGPQCYASTSVVPSETAILYGPPPTHLFHSAAIDPTIYTTTDGTTFVDPMQSQHHQAAMGHFGALTASYGMNEEGIFLERPDNCGTPRSYLTATPPSSEQQQQQQRSTATPVVSLLSLDFQQEKDPASMQGGRRPLPTAQQAPSSSSSSSAASAHQQQQQQQPPTPPQQSSHSFRRGGGGGHHYMNGGQQQQQRRIITSHHPQAPPPQQQRSFNSNNNYNHNHHHHHNNTQPPSFVPSLVRRPRNKTQRRFTNSGNNNGVNNEIGAGDAPLPTSSNNQEEVLASQLDGIKI